MEVVQHVVLSIARDDLSREALISAFSGVLFHLSIRPIEFELVMDHFIMAPVLGLSGCCTLFVEVSASSAHAGRIEGLN